MRPSVRSCCHSWGPSAVTFAMAWDDTEGWVSTIMKPPRFPLGQLVITRGALRALDDAGQDAMPFMARHQSGDSGELGEEDKRENEFAVHNGFCILSVPHGPGGTSVGHH